MMSESVLWQLESRIGWVLEPLGSCHSPWPEMVHGTQKGMGNWGQWENVPGSVQHSFSVPILAWNLLVFLRRLWFQVQIAIKLMQGTRGEGAEDGNHMVATLVWQQCIQTCPLVSPFRVETILSLPLISVGSFGLSCDYKANLSRLLTPARKVNDFFYYFWKESQLPFKTITWESTYIYKRNENSEACLW